MFKIQSENIDSVRNYLRPLANTVRRCATQKLKDTWVRIKDRINGDTYLQESSIEESLKTLYSRKELDNITDIIKFIQTANENDLASFVVLYGHHLNLIEEDIYKNWKKAQNDERSVLR